MGWEKLKRESDVQWGRCESGQFMEHNPPPVPLSPPLPSPSLPPDSHKGRLPEGHRKPFQEHTQGGKKDEGSFQAVRAETLIPEHLPGHAVITQTCKWLGGEPPTPVGQAFNMEAKVLGI